MRSVCRSLAALLLFACPLLGKAVIIRTQDPPPVLTTPPASFMFESCAGYYSGSQPVSTSTYGGCYQFENEAGGEITSLTLTFSEPKDDSSGQELATSAIWSSNGAGCSNGICTFTYTGGELPVDANLLIEEDGVPTADLSEFGTVQVDFTVASTPEPTSALLLATGMVALIGLGLRRRYA